MYTIKIPKTITVLYCNKKNILTVIGLITKKTLKLNLKLKLNKIENIILVTDEPVVKISNNQKKKIKTLQGTLTALIKQLFIETSTLIYKKLIFIGVGYRVFEVDNFLNKMLLFKLGFSHSLYYRIPKNIKIFCLKRTNLFIYGNSYQYVYQIASQIQSYKTPEIYKGKGILYDNQKIKLKEGKKLK